MLDEREAALDARLERAHAVTHAVPLTRTLRHVGRYQIHAVEEERIAAVVAGNPACGAARDGGKGEPEAEPGDAVSVAGAVFELNFRLGAAARALVEAELSVENIVEGTLAVYESRLAAWTIPTVI